MDFTPSPQVATLRERVLDFMDAEVYPVEREVMEALDDEVAAGVPYPEILVEIREKAQGEGLWNLFLPDERYGAGPDQLGVRAALRGDGPQPDRRAAMAFNCAAPDTGNMEILAEHGTRGAERALARAAARGADPLLLLDDRARGRPAPTRRCCRRGRCSTATSG